MATEPISDPPPEEPAPAPLTPLQQAQARLDAYLAAERKILEAQSYQVGDGAAARALQRARLEEVRAGIAACRAELAALMPRRRFSYFRPL